MLLSCQAYTYTGGKKILYSKKTKNKTFSIQFRIGFSFAQFYLFYFRKIKCIFHFFPSWIFMLVKMVAGYWDKMFASLHVLVAECAITDTILWPLLKKMFTVCFILLNYDLKSSLNDICTMCFFLQNSLFVIQRTICRTCIHIIFQRLQSLLINYIPNSKDFIIFSRLSPEK